MATTTTSKAPSVDTRRFGNFDRSDSINTNQQHQPENGSNTSLPATSRDGVPSQTTTETTPFKPTRRFWFVMASISAISLCGAVEGTIIMNALPTITAALGGGNLYLWVPNAFFLASIAVLPFCAQVSDIFGRRNMLLGTVFLFVLGCALCGASTSMKMLIVARTIQGVGCGGVDTLIETIVLDLVPLRERGKYMSIVALGTTVGFAAGPFLGGLIVQEIGWRWIFYINAIVSGLAFIMFFVFLRVKRPRGQNFWSKVKRIDFGGNAIFIGAVTAVLLALTWGGPVYHWDSAQIIVPLVVGLLGLGAFTAFEWTPRLAPEPSFPRVLISNRTSAAALAMTIINCITTTGTFYFLPVYFQGVLAKSPLESGVALAPVAATLIPFSMVGGTLMAKVGKYRPLHIFGWSLTLLSVGLCSTLNRHSSTAAWVCFEILSAAGIGSLIVSLLPAMQAPLSERQAATSAGMYVFARGFGAIWGVTLPSAIFNNVVKQHVKADQLTFGTNTTLTMRLMDGQAYQLATKAFLDSLPASDSMVRNQIVIIFEQAVHSVFYFLVALAGLGLLLVLLEKEIPMRKENNTEFGLDERENRDNEAHAGNVDGRSQHSDGTAQNSEVVDNIELEELRGSRSQRNVAS